MSLKGLFPVLSIHPEYRRHLQEVGNVVGHSRKPPEIAVRQGARPLYIAALWSHLKIPVVVITPRPGDARRLYDQVLTYLDDQGPDLQAPVYLCPEPEVLPFERLAVDANTTNQRLVALAALASVCRTASMAPEDGEVEEVAGPLVITSIGATLSKTLPRAAFSSVGLQQPAGAVSGPESPPSPLGERGHEGNFGNGLALRIGQRLRLNLFLPRLLDLGYHHEASVEAPGSFSQRGGIVDVYSPHSDLPFRLELLGDEIETIRLFDPYSQRSVRGVAEVRIIPAREQLPNLADRSLVDSLIQKMDFSICHPDVRSRMEEELETLLTDTNIETLSFYNGLLNHACLLEYVPKDALIVLDRWGQLQSEAEDMEERFAQMRTNREQRGELPRRFPAPHQEWEQFVEELGGHRRSLLQSPHIPPVEGGTEGGQADRIFHASPAFFGKMEQFAAGIRQFRSEGKAVVVVSQHSRRLAEILEQDGEGILNEAKALGKVPQPGGVYLVPGSLREGWMLAPHPTLILLTDAEIFGTVKERRQLRRQTKHSPAINLSELVPGSYVVHIDHGVARFAGTTRMVAPLEGIPSLPPSEGGIQGGKEYLVLEYADGDRLYVPTEHLDRVSAYVGAQDHQPTLTRLGSADWARTKERVRAETRETAEELLKLHAARQIAEGHPFGQDTVWQQELEDVFPYEETPDQALAITEVKADMEGPKPMDRLICGDVGYGKTEVALRASFKAVLDGRQVALLVPTTVLAQQHYATFSDRLSPFPFRVEVLSRFRTGKEQQDVIEGLAQGSVDIVVGTHRLLQKDVHFKNLGLVIVDEEQRFGVAHKERLKKLRKEVDVLTLSATPIPRTLYMALGGIRDMSTMDTSPEARLPVKTFVSEYSDDVIKEAILRELERGGQAFFLHNRVKTIYEAATHLSELAPQARVIIGHGQMPESELEEMMLAFSRGEADVLVCTTIIEAGLDLPNVNTLIVDRADRFGLSQLYQLRGRVGRGDHRAYAYLLVPRGRRITEAAEQRLEAILEASDLGWGFRVAMRDLEIRGAGNLLGAAQSGQIHAVGLDLYSQLLQEAVRELAEQPGAAGLVSPKAAKSELTRVELPLAAQIPEQYIAHLPTRLSVYQRLTRVTQRQEVTEIREELQDRFGPIPAEVENLLSLVDLRALAATLGIESVTRAGDSIVLALKDPVGGAKAPLQKALGPAAIVGNRQIQLPVWRLGEQWLSRLTKMVERLQVFRERLHVTAVG